MDITELAVEIEREEAGTTVHVKNAAGEPQYHGDGSKPVTILVAGSYSKRFVQAKDAQRNKNIRRRSTLTSEEITQQLVDLIAACVISWDGFTSGGSPFPCTRENVLAVLSAAPWILESVVEATNNHFYGTV